ncbi:hypothetical protein [uncultured Mediterranean phage uvMED]|nr:hypothetical protein [uncultured Mediterranean phage uvMED]
MSTIKVNRLENTATAAGGINIDSSGKCGFGTAAPKRQLHLNGGSEAVKLQITNTSTGSSTDGDGFQIGIATNGTAGIEQRENADLTFATNNSERMRILAGGGLTFNGDTAAANALDDYQEGTWTPGVDTGTISASNAHYIKIGNLVKVCAVIQSFSDRSSSNDVIVNNLPFNTTTAQAGGSMMGRNLDRSAFTAYVRNNDQKMEFYSIGSGTWTPLKHEHLNSTSSTIYFQASYIIT